MKKMENKISISYENMSEKDEELKRGRVELKRDKKGREQTHLST